MELTVPAIIHMLTEYGPLAAIVMMYLDKRQSLVEANKTIKAQHEEIKELSERVVAALTHNNTNTSTLIHVLGARK